MQKKTSMIMQDRRFFYRLFLTETINERALENDRPRVFEAMQTYSPSSASSTGQIDKEPKM